MSATRIFSNQYAPIGAACGGQVALEAALMERPVVPIRAGGLTKLLWCPTHGLLVPRDDATTTAEEIRSLLDQREHGIGSGRAARGMAHERCSRGRTLGRSATIHPSAAPSMTSPVAAAAPGSCGPRKRCPSLSAPPQRARSILRCKILHSRPHCPAQAASGSGFVARDQASGAGRRCLPARVGSSPRWRRTAAGGHTAQWSSARTHEQPFWRQPIGALG
jgi:hypothetical protein